MIVDRIITVPLDKKSAAKYAACAYEEYAKKRAAKVRCLGGGSFGIAYKVTSEDGESIVVKFMRADNMMQKEVFDLRLLRKSCPLDMPEVLFLRDKDDKIPVDCYGMTVMQGKPLLSSLCAFLWHQALQWQLSHTWQTSAAQFAGTAPLVSWPAEPSNNGFAYSSPQVAYYLR